MAKAKVTSKGQITIPAEIRAVLGVKTGDVLVFEARAEYVTVRRRPTVQEVAGTLHDKATIPPVYATDREAVAARAKILHPALSLRSTEGE